MMPTMDDDTQYDYHFSPEETSLIRKFCVIILGVMLFVLVCGLLPLDRWDISVVAITSWIAALIRIGFEDGKKQEKQQGETQVRFH
jgi:cell division protein FtsW (lipid II flippase)